MVWTLALVLLAMGAWWMSIHHKLRAKGLWTEPMIIWEGVAWRAPMAFIRKRGNIYYLVHNLRKQGRVRQLYLARLGHRARINEEVIAEVMAKHPFVRVDWKRLRERHPGNVCSRSKTIRGIYVAYFRRFITFISRLGIFTCRNYIRRLTASYDRN